MKTEEQKTKNGGGLGTRLATPGHTWACAHVKFTDLRAQINTVHLLLSERKPKNKNRGK